MNSPDAPKLFNVLVLGGLSMAVPACSSGTTGDDAGATDASTDQATSNDAASTPDVATCPPADKIQCPDCTHGLCGW